MAGDLQSITTSGAEMIDGIGKQVQIIDDVCRTMVDFCVSIVKITSFILGGNLCQIPQQIPKLVRCHKLCDMIKQFAYELLRFIQIFKDFFQAMIDKLNDLTTLNPLDMTQDAVAAVGDAVGDAVEDASSAVASIVDAPTSLGGLPFGKM